MHQIASVAHGAACSGAGKSLGALFAVLARALELCAGDLGAHQIAMTAWAFATVCWLDAPLFAVLAMAAEGLVAEFDKH